MKTFVSAIIESLNEVNLNDIFPLSPCPYHHNIGGAPKKIFQIPTEILEYQKHYIRCDTELTINERFKRLTQIDIELDRRRKL